MNRVVVKFDCYFQINDIRFIRVLLREWFELRHRCIGIIVRNVFQLFGPSWCFLLLAPGQPLNNGWRIRGSGNASRQRPGTAPPYIYRLAYAYIPAYAVCISLLSLTEGGNVCLNTKHLQPVRRPPTHKLLGLWRKIKLCEFYQECTNVRTYPNSTLKSRTQLNCTSLGTILIVYNHDLTKYTLSV